MDLKPLFSLGTAVALAAAACGDDDKDDKRKAACQAWDDMHAACSAILPDDFPATCEKAIFDCIEAELEILVAAGECAAKACEDGTAEDATSARKCFATVLLGVRKECVDLTILEGK